MPKRPTVIVLAAGRGSRFLGDNHKLEQPLGASTVLGTTLRHALVSGLPVCVVTTEALHEIACRSVAARDVVVLAAVGSEADEPLGMGYSIAAGVCANSSADGWIVMPGDMPMVQPATLLSVARELSHYPVAYAQYRGRRGHPVGFGAELYSELATLTGDEGARRLIARYPAQGVDVDDPGVLIDVDTEQDLQEVRLKRIDAASWPDEAQPRLAPSR
ncbi:MAG: molybdopterin-guanine dinucleotide biosynthesis protein MobA [Rhizobacter sp.]|nr:molybdopterin-guanine dinucleotide biosynthesis protein MobA [Rhizobacter sp.]